VTGVQTCALPISAAGELAPFAGQRRQLPPADLTFLVSTLYLQGAIGLGLLPNPVTQKAELQLDQAKHSIDMLAMLQQKTEGNRTPEESEDLEAALHELRMTFVSVSEQLGTGTQIGTKS
jgi:hypothetical protein